MEYIKSFFRKRSSESNFQEFKVIVVGDSNVGKTSLISRYVHGRAGVHEATKTPIVKRNYTTVRNERVQLNIWDTPGHETLDHQFYAGSHAVIAVYDLTKQVSFQNITEWLREIYDEAEPSIIYLIGNKVDKENERTVTRTSGEQFADCYRLEYFRETSAETSNDIDELFNGLADRLMERKREGRLNNLAQDIISPGPGERPLESNLDVIAPQVARVEETQALSGFTTEWKNNAVYLAISLLTFASIEFALPLILSRGFISSSIITSLRRYWAVRGTKDAVVASGLLGAVTQMDPTSLRLLITHLFDVLTKMSNRART